VSVYEDGWVEWREGKSSDTCVVPNHRAHRVRWRSVWAHWEVLGLTGHAWPRPQTPTNQSSAGQQRRSLVHWDCCCSWPVRSASFAPHNGPNYERAIGGLTHREMKGHDRWWWMGSAHWTHWGHIEATTDWWSPHIHSESNDETGGNHERPDSRASSGLDSTAEADNEAGEDAEDDNEATLRPNETSADLDKLVRDWVRPDTRLTAHSAGQWRR